MGIPHYLAMTAAELSQTAEAFTAWMACHFSPWGQGLSNLPDALPPDSILILDDSTPPQDHRTDTVFAQLQTVLEQTSARGLLLDFQRPDCPLTRQLAQDLSGTLPCPVAVSHLYAGDLTGPVFLPPVPLHSPLNAYLSPWQGRDIWLETALDGAVLTLTKDGCRIDAGGHPDQPAYAEERLHCHYCQRVSGDAAVFTLWRTREDLAELLEEAEALGVSTAVGLWQELKSPLLGEGGRA